MLAQYCFDVKTNVTITPGIAQGIATLGPAWASASKQYWAKIGATRDQADPIIFVVSYAIQTGTKVIGFLSLVRTTKHFTFCH